jgi:hypothetical protein
LPGHDWSAVRFHPTSPASCLMLLGWRASPSAPRMLGWRSSNSMQHCPSDLYVPSHVRLLRVRHVHVCYVGFARRTCGVARLLLRCARRWA